MLPYLAEFLGTMMLIMLGDGVCANVNLSKSGMKGGGTVQITMAWAAAVMIPAFIFGAASGASFNPALTIALAADGSFADVSKRQGNGKCWRNSSRHCSNRYHKSA